MSRLAIKILLIFLILSARENFSQTVKDSWSMSFGGTYPRMVSLWSGGWSGSDNYGSYVSIQRNFTEYIGLRLRGNYSYMETKYSGKTGKLDLISADADFTYNLFPCQTISPFLLGGMGLIYFSPDNAPEPELNGRFFQYQFNLGAGVEWKFIENWSLKGEGIYHTASTNALDGMDDPGKGKGLFGGNGDTYITFNLGFVFYFSKGEPSSICDLYQGFTVGNSPQIVIQEKIDTVKIYVPQEIVREVIVEKPVEINDTRWVLAGVNFETNSAKLRVESYPILKHAIQYLSENPNIKIEVQGHTDNEGSEDLNQKLSEQRALMISDYLAAKGIDSNRLTVRGYGELVPIADNNSDEGRAINRRIEFKIVDDKITQVKN
jgi:OOP family OmpA-OmpF porin